MAISSGVWPHRAWVSVNGLLLPIESGSAEQSSTRKSSTFSAELPMTYPGAYELFAGLGENESALVVLSKGAQVPLVSGEIDTIDFKFPPEGKIHVTGRCKSAKLHGQKSSEKFVNRKTSEIVQELAGRVGLAAEVDQGILQAGKYVQIDWAKMTDGISYAGVVHKLAEQDGARWFVTPQGVLRYQLLDNPAGIYTFNYSPGNPIEADFLGLSVKFNVQAGKTTNVTVKSWNPRKKKVFEHKSTVSGNSGQTEYTYHIPNLTQDRVQQFAKSKAREHSRHEYTLSIEAVGDPTIDVAMDLVLMGTGFFDQAYKIDSIHHSVGMEGHTMSISAKSAKAGREPS